ncbi:MAG: single-stranded-DNA-specific exonuclease RecJ [Desulfobacterales bacterium]|nr:single-stranded-DNA-specific exonuclease RecJ [Desulfobacterales bacterium]
MTPDPELTQRLSDALNCHPVLAGLLAQRGLNSPEEAEFFLDPDFSRLTNPFDLKDMQAGVERIYSAVLNNEKILVFGDFDADGVTATSTVFEFLTRAEADVAWYVPHRVKEGYSLQPDHIEIAVEMNVDLIITVDCGIGSAEAVEAARAEDIDVIVTDHHEPGDDFPEALAVINPKQPDCTAGLDYLAGVGVAFYLVMALRKHFREQQIWEEIEEPSLVEYLDLFAIGTIGDMVPLLGDNRTLCIAGMRQIRSGTRPAVKAMSQAARLDLSQMDSDDISYKLVPRINAAGRISHARICVSHLTAPTLNEAKTTAQLLDDLNLKRQHIEREIVLDIENRISRDPTLLDDRIIVLWDRRWEPTVLGIAASRLSRKYTCPVVLMSIKDGIATGSCRSVNQINIHQALGANADLLDRFGGHAMAAGLTLKEERLEDISIGLKDYLNTHCSDEDFIPKLSVDAELGIDDITLDLARAIDRLRPFGTANPEPLFMARNLWVGDSVILGNSHRKMVLKGEHSVNSVEALHFNLSDTSDLPAFYPTLLFHLKINKFKKHAAQMIVKEA